MKTNAMELRTLVMDNALTLGRLDAKTLGKEDYAELSKLYAVALNALTEWAGADYAHTATKAHENNAFAAVKAILELFATDEERIIIDKISMRTTRDLATKPKRLYSDAYTKAYKAYKNAKKVVDERTADLITLGCPERNENETAQEYSARITELGVNVVADGINMLEMYMSACAVLSVKTKAVDDIKAAGNWTWKRPVAVTLTEFAELVENYVADCLCEGYNIKSYDTIRKEQAEARAAAKAEKDNANA